jgi:hypothetical protein
LQDSDIDPDKYTDPDGNTYYKSGSDSNPNLHTHIYTDTCFIAHNHYYPAAHSHGDHPHSSDRYIRTASNR